MKKEALLYEKLENNRVHCYLCSHHCKIAEEKFGLCGVRQNIEGALYSHVYGDLIALNTDPIEKKPLYHFFPGSFSLSLATVGCNFRCGFCQNWEISQAPAKGGGLLQGRYVPPEEIVIAAKNNNCNSISYTYTEPTVFFEYAYETAKLAKSKGFHNNFVTNGYMSKEMLEMIKPYLGAANIDLKFFQEDSYRKICGASLEPVLNSIRLMHQLNIWIEITTLVLPAQNDTEEELGQIASFIAGIDRNIPWHISRFHPDYQFTDYRATSEAALKKAVQIGKDAGLEFVYAGNVTGWGNDTSCHNCKKLLIKREGFSILEYNIKEGKCPNCDAVIPGVFK